VIRALGEGGMGAVYLAQDETLGRHVAVKVVSRRYASEGESAARFLREARSMATVEHAHIVRVYAFGESGGQPYLVMEYVEGEDLAQRVKSGGRCRSRKHCGFCGRWWRRWRRRGSSASSTGTKKSECAPESGRTGQGQPGAAGAADV